MLFQFFFFPGPDQPDVDDYGFTSEDSSKLYNKLIQKMYNTPTDENKFAPSKKPNSSNLLGTKVSFQFKNYLIANLFLRLY